MVSREEPPRDDKAGRAEKLAAALRENLRRRKQQARLRAARTADADGERDPPGKE